MCVRLICARRRFACPVDCVLRTASPEATRFTYCAQGISSTACSPCSPPRPGSHSRWSISRNVRAYRRMEMILGWSLTARRRRRLSSVTLRACHWRSWLWLWPRVSPRVFRPRVFLWSTVCGNLIGAESLGSAYSPRFSWVIPNHSRSCCMFLFRESHEVS